MLEANFYKIDELSLAKFLGKLLESMVASGNKITIFCDSSEHVAKVDNLLWTYAQLSFLPHVTCFDEDRSFCSIYITNDNLDNSFESNVALLLTTKLPIVKFGKYVFCYTQDEVNIAKDFAKNFEKISYFSQDKSGKWIKSEAA